MLIPSIGISFSRRHSLCIASWVKPLLNSEETVPMKSLRAVVFDFDGTIAGLNVDFVRMRRAVLDLMVSYCNPPDTMEDLFVLEMIEAGRELISGRCPGRENEFFAEAHRLISSIEKEGAKEGSLLPGTEQMLLDLRRRNIKTGIVTRNCMAAVITLFPDVASKCDAVVARDHTKMVKPHPVHLLTALGFLQTEPVMAAMVGDHPMDIFVGREVGAYTIGVLTGYSEAAPLRQAGADLIIDKAPDIIGYL